MKILLSYILLFFSFALCGCRRQHAASVRPSTGAVSVGTVTNVSDVREWQSVSVSTQGHLSSAAYITFAQAHISTHLTGQVDVTTFDFAAAWAMHPIGSSLSTQLQDLVRLEVRSPRSEWKHPEPEASQFDKLIVIMTKDGQVVYLKESQPEEIGFTVTLEN